MDRQTEAKARYERLRKTLSDEKKSRKKSRLARAIGLAVVGVWVILPAILWRVDLESAARPEFFRTPTPHEAYLLELVRGGRVRASDEEGIPQPSEGLGVARGWEAAAYRAIDAPLAVGSAYQEFGVFPAEETVALGLRIHIPEGQRLRLSMEVSEGSPADLFLDLFKAAPDGESRPAFVQVAELEEGRWYFDPPGAGDYVIRSQTRIGPEFGYRIAVQVGAPWTFPVAGADRGDIGSFFGDARDGGSRDHHGVDIFASRNTPVLAAADGRVSRVDTTEIGGRVVWQREAGDRGHSIYYAHLERPLVQNGQRLQAGDTVGLVGNTGNARTTPPHLHFGAYRRGPVDPWNLILPIPPRASEVAVSLDGLGREGRVGEEGVRLRRSPSTRGSIMEEIPRDSAFQILGGAGEWFRIVLQGGESGFIHSRYTSVATPEGTRSSNQQ